jgi:hypothetical protein
VNRELRTGNREEGIERDAEKEELAETVISASSFFGFLK